MKTSRALIVLALMTTVICMFSCKNGINGKSSNKDSTIVDTLSKDSTKVDTLWNDSVQHVFFDTPFGASEDELIKNFAKHGLKLNKDASDFGFSMLVFNPAPGKRITFEGMTWERVQVYLANKFDYISFYTKGTKNKATAISNFNNVVDKLSQKYILTKIEPDSAHIKADEVRMVFSKSGLRAKVFCGEVECLDKKDNYYDTQLDYYVMYK